MLIRSVIAATAQSSFGPKITQFSYLHATFYLQRLELRTQNGVKNVACNPALASKRKLPTVLSRCNTGLNKL